MDLDFWDCFIRNKTLSYNRRNTVLLTAVNRADTVVLVDRHFWYWLAWSPKQVGKFSWYCPCEHDDALVCGVKYSRI